MENQTLLTKDFLNGKKEKSIIDQLVDRLKNPTPTFPENSLEEISLAEMIQLSKLLMKFDAKRNASTTSISDSFLNGLSKANKPISNEYWMPIYLKDIIIPFINGTKVNMETLKKFNENEKIFEDTPIDFDDIDTDNSIIVIILVGVVGFFMGTTTVLAIDKWG